MLRMAFTFLFVYHLNYSFSLGRFVYKFWRQKLNVESIVIMVKLFIDNFNYKKKLDSFRNLKIFSIFLLYVIFG